MKKALLMICCVIAVTTALANDIFKGLVQDAITNEPLQGASIRLLDANGKNVKNTLSGLDGSFALRNVANGSYQIEISYLGYGKTQQTFILKESTVTQFFALTPSGKELNNVTVVAKGDKGSEVATLTVERKADNIINVVSAKTIEVSPDLSVANVTQRVAGVSLQRSNNGEGQYAIVRGMDKRYNYTLVNGIKIPSPDNKNRYVPLDIFRPNY